MRVLVTGASGFTGTRMMQFLLEQEGVTVTGLVRTAPAPAPDTKSRISYACTDLLDRNRLISTVARVSPDAIIHLGGLTRGPLDALLLANVTGTKNLLDAGYAANPECRMLIVSSSAVYGYAGTAPIAESMQLQPLSEYGISKLAQDTYSLMFHTLNDAPVCVTRPFNLAGPGQPESFICGRIVKQVIEIGQQKRAALELLETISSRDLIDVRDVVRGYWALVSHPDFTSDCAGKAFNLGSGTATPLSVIIALIEEITGRHYEVEYPGTRPRIPILSQQSDNTRITGLTGWRPGISLKETLSDMLAAVQNPTR
jgi:GDP-4-dehydro-6-deoxy-D-mannose reductase